MAPAKRGRPAFSPPRPVTVSTAMKGREAGWKNQKNAAIARKNATIARKRAAGEAIGRKSTGSARKRGRPSRVAHDDDEDDETDGSEDNSRSALALVDMQAGEDNDGDSDEEDDDDGEQEDGDEDDDHRRSSKRGDVPQNSSPEPDMILAEITTTNEPSAAAIPEKLVHRLLAHHFEHGEKTKISTDARDLVGKYLEIFVREAIMRSAYERDERQPGDGGVGGGGATGGFLEVEDLEKAAVQLCLDF